VRIQRQTIGGLCLGVFLCGTLLAAPDSGLTSTKFSLHDYRGKAVSLDDFSESKLVVVAFLGTECPLAKLYAGRLQEISHSYPSEQVAVVGIVSNQQDSITEIDAFVRRQKLTFPVLKDPGNQVADQFSATRTPEVFLLDGTRRVRYCGRIDDQYVVGIVREKPQREDLKLAIAELLGGKGVSVEQTQPLGCLIGRITPPNENSSVTYSKQISRIFQNHCVECHRPGEIAPFTLTSYADVLGWGPMIAEVVREQRMPPWHADPHHGNFLNDTSLSAEERGLIQSWVEEGCPEGDPRELPEPRHFVEGWQLPRNPDAVIAMAERPFQVPADAGPEGVRYQQFWVPTNLKEDRWINGAEVRPGNRSVVHHVIVYASPERNRTKGQEFLVAYVPGLRLNPLPPGAAKKIPAGAWLRFEVHYTPIGIPQEDLTSVGFLFTDPDKVTHQVKTTPVANDKFELQPHEDHQVVTAHSKSLPVSVDLISFSPHMHLRGKSFRYEAEYADGTREILLDVPRYDFNWQTQYRLKTPKAFPAGSKMHCTAVFDNSSRNLANPDPNAIVRWGDQSWEEMMIGYIDIIYPVNARESTTGKNPGAAAVQIDAASIIKRYDRDSDGRISRTEADPAEVLKKAFDRVDANDDGFADAEEIHRALVKAGLAKD
jgi:peroxiredoxin